MKEHSTIKDIIGYSGIGFRKLLMVISLGDLKVNNISWEKWKFNPEDFSTIMTLSGFKLKGDCYYK